MHSVSVLTKENDTRSDLEDHAQLGSQTGIPDSRFSASLERKNNQEQNRQKKKKRWGWSVVADFRSWVMDTWG